MRVETKQVLIYSATFFSATVIVAVVGFSLLSDVERKVRARTEELNEKYDDAVKKNSACQTELKQLRDSWYYKFPIGIPCLITLGILLVCFGVGAFFLVRRKQFENTSQLDSITNLQSRIEDVSLQNSTQQEKLRTENDALHRKLAAAQQSSRDNVARANKEWIVQSEERLEELTQKMNNEIQKLKEQSVTKVSEKLVQLLVYQIKKFGEDRTVRPYAKRMYERGRFGIPVESAHYKEIWDWKECKKLLYSYIVNAFRIINTNTELPDFEAGSNQINQQKITPLTALDFTEYTDEMIKSNREFAVIK
jgi:F0F1-type ATP synthase membrane subunit b/b'